MPGQPTPADSAGIDAMGGRLSAVDAVWSALERFATSRRGTIRAAATLFLVALLCRLPALTSFSISIDDERAALRTDARIWAQQGRWGNWILESLSGQPVVPVFNEVLFCAAATVSYLLLLHAHRISFRPAAGAAFPVFCAYPQWDFIGEFYANVPGVSLGLLAVSAAGWWFQRTWVADRPRAARGCWLAAAGQAFLVALATGCYQFFLLMFVSVGLGIVLCDQMSSGRRTRATLVRQIAALVAVTVAAGAVYVGISAAVLHFIDMPLRYVRRLVDPRLPFTDPGRALAQTCTQVIHTLCGSAAVYGHAIWGAVILMMAGWGALLTVDGSWLPRARKTLLAALAAGCCLVPFAMQPVAPDPLPPRSMMAVPYVVWLFAILPLWSPGKGWRLAAFAGMAIAALQVFHGAAVAAGARQWVAEHDRQLAAAVYERLVSVHPDFNLDREYPVLFVGAKRYALPAYSVAPDTTAQGSFFAWDGGNPLRMTLYMNLMGYANVVLPPPGTPERLRDVVEGMPDWPAAGSVRVADGITVVRFGPAPLRK